MNILGRMLEVMEISYRDHNRKENIRLKVKDQLKATNKKLIYAIIYNMKYKISKSTI